MLGWGKIDCIKDRYVMADLTREEYEAVEAEFLGISVECLRAIRTPPKKWRRPAKRLKGNKYVKFNPNPENT